VISTAITCYELMIRIDWTWENWIAALLLFFVVVWLMKVFLGVTTFRKSESIQLHCIAKLAKSYSFLAFLEDGTSFALCDVCDAERVVLEDLEKMRSHRRLGCFRSLPCFTRHV